MTTLKLETGKNGIYVSSSDRQVTIEVHLAPECDLRSVLLRSEVQASLRRLLADPKCSPCTRIIVNDNMNWWFHHPKGSSRELEAIRASGQSFDQLSMPIDHPLSLSINGFAFVEDRVANAIVRLTPPPATLKNPLRWLREKFDNRFSAIAPLQPAAVSAHQIMLEPTAPANTLPNSPAAPGPLPVTTEPSITTA